MAEMLTETERAILEALAMRPDGGMVRGDEEKLATLSLAAKAYVCDPHEMGATLFTRITDAGRDALRQPDKAGG